MASCRPASETCVFQRSRRPGFRPLKCLHDFTFANYALQPEAIRGLLLLPSHQVQGGNGYGRPTIMDIVSPKRRSQMMAGIKGKGTRPELNVRRVVHGMGFRFRLHPRDLPGTPDLVFPRMRLALYVNGCFWHRHENCKFSYTPKTNIDFWNSKFEVNVARDVKKTGELEGMGWRVAVIWECQTADPVELRKILGAILGV
jgi:DNA mismatch endonuclease (patch repair protein)